MMAELAKLPRGISVFVDANILVYYFTQMPPLTEACKVFFERVSRLQVKAFTSAYVAADVIHRIMLAEAIATLGLAPRDAVSYLKSHPDAVKQLQWYKTIPSDIAQARVRILDVTYRELHASKKYRADHGLLTADSIILAVMERHKLIHLVSNDHDFERVPGIRVWRPR
jgi:predicted nucleic acid-binding protein